MLYYYRPRASQVTSPGGGGSASTGRGGVLHPGGFASGARGVCIQGVEGVCIQGRGGLPNWESGRYAFYWNAFLCYLEVASGGRRFPADVTDVRFESGVNGLNKQH